MILGRSPARLPDYVRNVPYQPERGHPGGGSCSTRGWRFVRSRHYRSKPRRPSPDTGSSTLPEKSLFIATHAAAAAARLDTPSFSFALAKCLRTVRSVIPSTAPM